MTFNKRKPAISEAARVAGREGSGEGHAGSSAPRKATGQDRHSKKDDRLEEHSTGRGPFQQRASFGAILAGAKRLQCLKPAVCELYSIFPNKWR